MKKEIISNIDNPRQLEKLYRDNKATFKREFNLIYPSIQETPTAQIWNERLNFEKDDTSWGTSKELIFVIIASIIAVLIAKIPEFTTLEEKFFYPRNLSFIVFPLLIAYFSWKQKIKIAKNIIISFVIIFSLFYINLLPSESGQTLLLACLHLPLFLWSVLAYAFVGDELKNYNKRIDFLRYNGDLVVMTSIILLAGVILTGITIGLFSFINLDINGFYFRYIVIWGLVASPIVATYLVQTNPQLVKRVSPVIAKVFTPLVLITLVIYLISILATGNDPFYDREFLLIFNLLLIAVMSLILFSIAETSKQSDSKIWAILLLCLSTVTIIVNGIALSAILFRIYEWGISPNKLAVIGWNILILINLLMVTYRLFKTTIDKDEIENVKRSIAFFLPIYSVWAVIICFVFPVIFNFK